MAMKNKYAYRSKISKAKIRQIVRLFVVDLDVSQITAVTNLKEILSIVTLPPLEKESFAIVSRNPLLAAKLKWMRVTSAHAGSKA